MEWPSYSGRASGPDEIQDIGEWVEGWLPRRSSLSPSLLTPPAPPDPCVETAKTGPELGSRTALSQALSNDKNR